MRRIELAILILLALVLAVASVFLGGCSESKLRALAEDQSAKVAAIGAKGQAAARDLSVLEGIIAATPAKTDGSPDFSAIIGTFNRDQNITTDTRLAISGYAAAGKSPEQIVRSLQGQLATDGRALLAAFEQGKMELDKMTREADKAAERDDAWWGLGDLGIGLLATLVPGAGIAAGVYGRAKGIIRGRADGAAMTARHVAMARATDPIIDAAFNNTPKADALRALLGVLPDEVRTAILENKDVKQQPSAATVS